jgi:hypothetical protein
MMKVFQNEEFDGFRDHDSGTVFENLEFKNCIFSSCSISRTDNTDKRSRIHNVRIFNCEVAGCFLGPAILDEIIVDGLKIQKRLIAGGCALQHVVLRGEIDRLLLVGIVPNLLATPEYRKRVEARFDLVNTQFYRHIDWALDISEAEFSDFDVRGIPSCLIRRDTFTQAVVKREKVLNDEWKKVDLSDTWWPVSLEMLAASNWEDHTLVAPKRHPQFSQALKGLYRLREAGIAEPD